MVIVTLKGLIPKRVILFYHRLLAKLAGFIYGYPSRKMIVIGVTGTGGKSTVVNLIGRILEEADYKCGWTTTFNFKIAGREWVNKTKMTMLGRFGLQKLLKQMVRAGCQYVIIETSSEGIIQSRHLGIDYDLAVFTNLTPEHIEAHGSFEKYRKAKGKLFVKLKNSKTKKLRNKIVKKVSIVNLDDKNAGYFLGFPADEYYGYAVINEKFPPEVDPDCGREKIKNEKRQSKIKNIKIIEVESIKLTGYGSEFEVNNIKFELNLLGKFNIYNSLAAICVGLSQGIRLETCQKAFKKIKSIPGRMEVIARDPFTVIVDYAHTPDSLEKVYKTLQSTTNNQQPTTDNQQPTTKLICVLGATGGGRDKWKRPELGRIAAKYCHSVIITNEDPYDENPEQILLEIKSGVTSYKLQVTNLYEILDRKQAIRKALNLAKPGDTVVITGKGCEQCIMGPKGKKISWDDRETVKELLK